MSPATSQRAAEALRFIAERDPELLAAAREVDRTLLSWYLTLTPRQRLDACSNAARALSRFHRVTPTHG